MRFLACACTIALFVAGCARGAEDTGGEDAGPPPTRDAGPGVDAFVPGIDGGPLPGTDAGPRPDAGGAETDAGTSVCGDCSFLDGVCTVGRCNPATESCETAPAPEGASCDDGDPCTEADRCAGPGLCEGTAVDCSGAASGPCEVGACDPATGACTTSPAADGTDCDASADDCVAETCQTGVCTGAPAADCSSCSAGGGTVCSGGVCGGPPTMLTYDFEAGMPAGWTVGGDAGWVVDGTRAHGGASGAHSGAIAHSQISSMTATFDVAVSADLAFWLTTSSESGFDHLEVWVDGARQGSWSGTTAWTEVRVALGGPGTHTVEWRYDKDGSVDSGDDRVWIDDVRVLPGVPTEGFESTALPGGYTTTGDASWAPSTSDAHGGSRSARSGAIGHSQETRLHRTISVSSATTLDFWYRVSSESGYDYLEFYLDGVREDRWSGSVGWSQASYALSPGSHDLEWRYVKDGSVDGGSDAAWIDDVRAGDPASGSLCGP